MRHGTFQCSQFRIDTAYAKLIIVTNEASIHRFNGKMVLKNTLISVVVVLKQNNLCQLHQPLITLYKHGHQAVVKQMGTIEISVTFNIINFLK